ncbi:DUF2318 domain-containing protein [Oxalobacter sp. OxGP1]|uniref:DUF2318 domain-containing protein n=1 Tax=Oxalobacter paeniformigenes TaxID=2946594 RepID=UPI0022AE5A86|nr:DUF2318 domain-containing protein [Oxalobacter paeniformigenes]MCZ4053829.1 DUF2318 domain-containing protein [Oxalobacter paeniformigenes]
MLQYLVEVVMALFPACVLSGGLYGVWGHQDDGRRKHMFVGAFSCALTIAVLAAVLRLTTNFFVREYFNLACLAVAMVAESIWFFCSRSQSVVCRVSKEGAGRWVYFCAVAACLSYALPDLFLYPSEFAVGFDDPFHAEVLFKTIGYALALALSLAGGWVVSRMISGMSQVQARRTVSLWLAFFALWQFIQLFRIVMLRSALMQSDVLMELLLFLLEYEFVPVGALLLAVGCSAVYSIVSCRKVVFSGENPAVVRKKKAQVRNRMRWNFSGLVSVALAVFVMTACNWMANRTVELSPPVELAASGRKIEIGLDTVNDGHLHRFAYTAENGTQMRYIIIRKSESAYGVALDACDICGPSGYYERDGQVVCILCDVVMNIGTIGMPGGCNPVPLAHEISDGKIVIDTADLEAEVHRFE